MSTNIARNSKFKIQIDPSKSIGSILYDDITKNHYLDFFGMYSSCPIGYNHPVFRKKEYLQEILDYSSVKFTNCEFSSKASLSFDKEFVDFCSLNGEFTNFHYCCTGSLAVEAAIKAAIHYKKYKPLKILTLKNSFHGANSFGVFVTDRIYPAASKLKGYPEDFSIKINPDLEELERQIKTNEITCVLLEPIRCSAGDLYSDVNFLKGAREICTKFNVPLIFDEIQVGFCSTGKIWYFERLGITPDIVIFGKKSQISGFMCTKKFSGIFELANNTRLDVTFNGDILDMIRCKYIIQAVKEEDLLSNAILRGQQIIEFLKSFDGKILNPRGSGLIIGFDCESKTKRDTLVSNLYSRQLLCNSTGEKSVRLRPNLAVSKNDLENFFSIFKEAIEENNVN